MDAWDFVVRGQRSPCSELGVYGSGIVAKFIFRGLSSCEHLQASEQDCWVDTDVCSSQPFFWEASRRRNFPFIFYVTQTPSGDFYLYAIQPSIDVSSSFTLPSLVLGYHVFVFAT
jgi:hypothetical protein